MVRICKNCTMEMCRDKAVYVQVWIFCPRLTRVTWLMRTSLNMMGVFACGSVVIVTLLSFCSVRSEHSHGLML